MGHPVHRMWTFSVHEPDRGGDVRRGVPRPRQEDAGDRRPQAAQDGAREGGIPHHVAARDQHAAHLTGRHLNRHFALWEIFGRFWGDFSSWQLAVQGDPSA